MVMDGSFYTLHKRTVYVCMSYVECIKGKDTEHRRNTECKMQLCSFESRGSKQATATSQGKPRMVQT